MALRYGVQNIRRISTKHKNYHTTPKNYYKKLGNTENSKLDDWDQAKPYSLIPGPKPIPIVGNVWRYMPGGEYYKKSILDIFQSLRSQYGDIVMFGGFPLMRDQVLIFNPAWTEIFLRNEGVYPVRRTLDSLQYYREHVRKDVFQGVGGLATSNGEDWFKVRSVVNKILMQPSMARIYVKSMDEVANEFIDNIRRFSKSNPNREMPEDFQNEIFKWTLESAGLLAYNKRLGCLEQNTSEEAQCLIDNSLEMLQLMYHLDYRPSLWKYVSTRNWRKYVRVLDYMTFTNVKHIEACLEEVKNRKTDLPENEQSVLERLIKIDKKIAITMAIGIVTGGVDTTGKVAATILYYLAKDPTKQDKLRQEIRKYMPRKDSPVTEEMVQQTPYLKAVIKEATRIAPVFLGVPRTTVKDLVIGGYQIPKGSNLLSANLLLGNDEKYFKNPQLFLPERWLRDVDDEYSVKHVNPFVSLPFGFGPRACIGKRLANLELEVGIAKMIRNFKFSWPHQDAKFNVILTYGIADPLKFRVEETED